MKNKHLLLPIPLIAIIFCVLSLSCSTQKQVVQEPTPLKTVSYNYDPKTTEPAGSVGIGMILISPNFEQNTFRYYNARPFSEFKKSLQSDLEEMITARGFSFRGPFNGYDEITYNDKKSTDMVIEVEILPNLQQLTPKPWNVHSQYHYVYGGQSYNTYTYSYEGQLSLSGKIKITFSEIMSHEKIYIRNVEIPEKVFDVVGENKYSDHEYLPLGDPGIYNPLVTALEEVYKASMEKTWAFFDPEEIKSWLPQLKELREKKRY